MGNDVILLLLLLCSVRLLLVDERGAVSRGGYRIWEIEKGRRNGE